MSATWAPPTSTERVGHPAAAQPHPLRTGGFWLLAVATVSLLAGALDGGLPVVLLLTGLGTGWLLVTNRDGGRDRPVVAMCVVVTTGLAVVGLLRLLGPSQLELVGRPGSSTPGKEFTAVSLTSLAVTALVVARWWSACRAAVPEGVLFRMWSRSVSAGGMIVPLLVITQGVQVGGGPAGGVIGGGLVVIHILVMLLATCWVLQLAAVLLSEALGETAAGTRATVRVIAAGLLLAVPASLVVGVLPAAPVLITTGQAVTGPTVACTITTPEDGPDLPFLLDASSIQPVEERAGGGVVAAVPLRAQDGSGSGGVLVAAGGGEGSPLLDSGDGTVTASVQTRTGELSITCR